MEDCRNCKHWETCPCGKQGHENGTSIGYSIGECKDSYLMDSEFIGMGSIAIDVPKS